MLGFTWKQIGVISLIAVLAVAGYNRFLAPKVGVSA